jgi:hypothetical protein
MKSKWVPNATGFSGSLKKARRPPAVLAVARAFVVV